MAADFFLVAGNVGLPFLKKNETNITTRSRNGNTFINLFDFWVYQHLIVFLYLPPKTHDGSVLLLLIILLLLIKLTKSHAHIN